LKSTFVGRATRYASLGRVRNRREEGGGRRREGRKREGGKEEAGGRPVNEIAREYLPNLSEQLRKVTDLLHLYWYSLVPS
jgi:hypothetical protein